MGRQAGVEGVWREGTVRAVKPTREFRNRPAQLFYDVQKVLMTLLVLASLVVELRFIRTTFAKFRLPSNKVVTGKFEGAEAFTTSRREPTCE